MELEDLMRERHIGEYLAQETTEERAIQDQLVDLVMWEFIFSDVFCYRDTVERTHGIRFEIRPKEKGHNEPHCHASYQGQEVSIAVEDFFTGTLVEPSAGEQQKIAEILETCDRVIELKRQLLEEKHRQKKWLMQKLLDPNSCVKLPGFESGKWRKIVIGEECEMFSGGTPKAGKDEYYTGGTIPFIRSGEIAENKTELFLTRDGYNSSSAKMVEVGDLLYALYGANSGECAISQINGAINQAILCVRPKHIERKVLYYLLCAKKERIIATYLQGGQGNLSAEIIKKLIVELPVDREHQSRIVEILHMADQEIVCSESELAEWQQKKKALMQLLLTGIVRVHP